MSAPAPTIGPTRLASNVRRPPPVQETLMPHRIHSPEQSRERVKKPAGRSMKSLVMAVSLAFGASGGAFAQPAAPQAEVQPVLTKDLGDLPGKEGLLLRVTYPPGSADQVHRHDAHGFVYVEEGSVVMQVRGGQPV